MFLEFLFGNLVEDNVLGVFVWCMEGLMCFSRYCVFRNMAYMLCVLDYLRKVSRIIHSGHGGIC